MIALTTYAINLCASAIAADANGYGGQANMGLRLVGIDFTPDANLTLGDLTYLAADGLDPKTGAAAAAQLAWDSEMGVWGIAPVFTGGTIFTCVTPTDPVKTAFGWALVNTDVGELICTGKFDTPVVFDHIGVQAHVPEVMTWMAAPLAGDLPTVSV